MAILDIVLPAVLWCAWWHWGVNWRRCWPILAAGGWAAVICLALMVTLLWTELDPAACKCLPFLTLPAFLSHLASVLLLVLVALFCGWLQGKFGWAPAEIVIDPPMSEQGVPISDPGSLVLSGARPFPSLRETRP